METEKPVGPIAKDGEAAGSPHPASVTAQREETSSAVTVTARGKGRRAPSRKKARKWDGKGWRYD